MQLRSSVLSLLTALTLAACGGSSSSTPLHAGETCDMADDLCDSSQDLACESDSTCRLEMVGDSCDPNADFCSLDASLYCDPATSECAEVPVCLDDDLPCTQDAECCSAVCAGDGLCGVPACGAPGDGCGSDTDCCSQFCDGTGVCN